MRSGISLTNRHMLSIVSCKSLGIPASGYLNTWKVGTLWTRSIEVAQQPKICSANHSHTRSLIPVASSPKSPVLLKTGRRWQPVTLSLILLVRSAQFGLGQGESGPRLFLPRRWASWGGTGPLARLDLATLQGFIFLMMREGTAIGAPLFRRPAQ